LLLKGRKGREANREEREEMLVLLEEDLEVVGERGFWRDSRLEYLCKDMADRQCEIGLNKREF